MDLDSTYVHTNPAEISERELCKVLKQHVKKQYGANVKYGISSHIPKNQIGGEFEGMDRLFMEP